MCVCVCVCVQDNVLEKTSAVTVWANLSQIQKQIG